MREAEMFRTILFGILACGIAWTTFSRNDADIGREREGATVGQRYAPLISGTLLPTILIVLGGFAIWLAGPTEALRILLPMYFVIFLQIGVYYALLLPVLPFLRKKISARTCAILWLLPTYLYYIFYSAMRLPEPYWVIYIPGKAAWILFGTWLVGFIAVMAWKIAEHLVFRHSILREAREVYDPAVRRVWDDVIEEARIKNPKFKLVMSANVRTPVSIGLYKRTIRVVLPMRDYAPEELRLVLRHEIIHIAREDAWTKFFMTFCTAMCWFNPLMWIAMRKSAEDIELSCDETVLLEADGKIRKQYGMLLLETAADERGFTTCLSASALAMRYRLTNIIKPQKRRSGALVVGVLLFALCMTGGYVTLAYGGITGAAAIYLGEDPMRYTVCSVEKEEGRYDREYTVVDVEGLHQYLSTLEMAEITGNYSFQEIGTEFEFTIEAPTQIISLSLYDDYAKVDMSHREAPRSRMYYIPGGVDWSCIEQLIEVKQP